jgi:hypothetical protein
MMTITVHNAQGASDQHKAETRTGINRWLASWSDPENLTARVVDEHGELMAEKYTGRKTLVWLYPTTTKLVKLMREMEAR